MNAPEHALALGFAESVARWSRAHGANAASVAAARAAAYGASIATSQGHVCVDLAALDDPAFSVDRAALPALLAASGVVGTPEVPGAMPLIVDSDGRIYLRRYFDYECRLARRLLAARRAPARAIDEATRAHLRQLFARDAAHPAPAVDWQTLAAALALSRPLTIVSGGPGTGKTTTIVNILACLVAQDPHCRVALAAPTGKAATRMQQALREHAGRLPATLRTRLPTTASTVHRLLGVRPGERGFRHHRGNPLAIDVLVVDEASMLDLALATRLLEAVPPGARIVLCGDKDQLAAVEAGAVFAELSAAPVLTPACVAELAAITGIAESAIVPPATTTCGLADSVIWLAENFRFAAGSGIGRLAAAINAGDAPDALAQLAAGADPGVRWIDDGAPRPADATLGAIDAGFADYIAALTAVRIPDVATHAADAATAAATVFAAFERFRVLCAEREGPRGVAGINATTARRLRARLGAADVGDETWYHGRPVMALRNDYALRLFNGDIGLALADAAGALSVWFPEADGGLRAIAPARLPEHDTAFAVTVHKAQGSEADAVLLVLPAGASRAVTRELLYTGVTRARRSATLAGGSEAIGAGIRRPTRRDSGLSARLRDAATESAATAKDEAPRQPMP